MSKEILVSLHGKRIGLSQDGSLIINGQQVFPFPNPTGAQDYWVDGNVSATGSGDVITSPYKTLAEAIAASDISIALTANRWGARRNRIFVMGDRLTEDLVKFPTKCDVIGAGSLDGVAGKVGLSGNHVPIGESYGTRFFNIQFEPAAASDLIVVTSVASGMEFHACNFIGTFGAVTAPSAIDVTGSELMRIIGCEFQGGFSANYIDIGAGIVNGMRILDNIMSGGAKDGIMVTGTATITSFGSRGVIAGNKIQCTNITLDVNATSVFNVFDNYLMTPAAFGGTSHVIDLTYACNNRLTANDAFAYIPPEPA